MLALTCNIELFTQAHYRRASSPTPRSPPLWKDVFLFHWKEESQHAILDELEWTREDAADAGRARPAVDDLIALVGAVDGMLQAQAKADVRYFCDVAESRYTGAQMAELEAGVLKAYRWQYIGSGAQHPRFVKLLTGLITQAQAERVTRALAPLMA